MDQKFIDRFDTLSKVGDTDDPQLRQRRGYVFEELINDIFAEEGVLLRSSYHTEDNRREQIDGAIEIWNRILLMEIKWVTSDLAASELYSFIGKVENKFHGSLGVFISRKELTDNFIRSLNTGRRQNVIVIHGNDIDELFKPDSPPITKYIEHCIKLLSYDNVTHCAFSDFAKGYMSPEEVAKNAEKQERDFIANYLNNAQEVTDDDRVQAYRKLDEQMKKNVYRYVFNNYDRIYLSPVTTFRSYIKCNYVDYWHLIYPSSKEVEGTENEYFTKKLLSEFRIYARPYIFRIYKDKYGDLDMVTRDMFEKELIKQLEEAGKFNHWELEDMITTVVEALWDKFQEETIEKLKDIYIYVYLDGYRAERSVHKQFANKLLKERITTDELRLWVESKLKSFIHDTGTVEDSVLGLFLFTYSELFPLIGLRPEEYKTFVQEKAYEYMNAIKTK